MIAYSSSKAALVLIVGFKVLMNFVPHLFTDSGFEIALYFIGLDDVLIVLALHHGHELFDPNFAVVIFVHL